MNKFGTSLGYTFTQPDRTKVASRRNVHYLLGTLRLVATSRQPCCDRAVEILGFRTPELLHTPSSCRSGTTASLQRTLGYEKPHTAPSFPAVHTKRPYQNLIRPFLVVRSVISSAWRLGVAAILQCARTVVAAWRSCIPGVSGIAPYTTFCALAQQNPRKLVFVGGQMHNLRAGDSGKGTDNVHVVLAL